MRNFELERPLRFVAVALVFASTVAGPLPWASAAPPTRLVVALSTEPPNLDPSRAVEFAQHNITFAVFDTLVHLDPAMRIVPGLAMRWRTLNPTTWQFMLRRGVKFQDGEPFNAQAVKFSIDFMKRKSSRYATRLTNINGAEAVSDDTVNISTASRRGKHRVRLGGDHL